MSCQRSPIAIKIFFYELDHVNTSTSTHRHCQIKPPCSDRRKSRPGMLAVPPTTHLSRSLNNCDNTSIKAPIKKNKTLQRCSILTGAERGVGRGDRLPTEAGVVTGLGVPGGGPAMDRLWWPGPQSCFDGWFAGTPVMRWVGVEGAGLFNWKGSQMVASSLLQLRRRTRYSWEVTRWAVSQ